MRARDRADALLVDAGSQETAFDFTVLRNERSNGRAGYTCIKPPAPWGWNAAPGREATTS